MVYLDQRGSGNSERPWTRDYRVQALVEDIESLRNTLGVDRLALMPERFTSGVTTFMTM